MRRAKRDFVLVVSTSAVEAASDIRTIKSSMQNLELTLGSFCQDEELLTKDYFTEEAERLLRFFKEEMEDCGNSIHNYQTCRLLSVTKFEIRILPISNYLAFYRLFQGIFCTFAH